MINATSLRLKLDFFTTQWTQLKTKLMISPNKSRKTCFTRRFSLNNQIQRQKIKFNSSKLRASVKNANAPGRVGWMQEPRLKCGSSRRRETGAPKPPTATSVRCLLLSKMRNYASQRSHSEAQTCQHELPPGSTLRHQNKNLTKSSVLKHHHRDTLQKSPCGDINCLKEWQVKSQHWFWDVDL